MIAMCHNCDRYVPLPECLDPRTGVPTCPRCGGPLYGYEQGYVRCTACRYGYSAKWKKCPNCGWPQRGDQEQPATAVPTPMDKDALAAYAEALLDRFGHLDRRAAPRAGSPQRIESISHDAGSGNLRDGRLSAITNNVRRCRRCGLCKTRTRPVPGEGPAEAMAMFIGEAPGRYEDMSGQPFVGASGSLLDSFLESLGLHRSEVYITNAIKCRPPNNREPRPEEIQACHPHLQRQLMTIHPRVVVTLGSFATHLFMPNARISQVHGRSRRIQGFWVLPMYHPAAVLRAPGELGPVFKKDGEELLHFLGRNVQGRQVDLQRLFAIEDSPEHPHRMAASSPEEGARPRGRVTYESSAHRYRLHDDGVALEYSVLVDGSDVCQAADEIARHEIIAVDIETSGLDPFSDDLLLLQVATPDRVYILDCTSVDVAPLGPILENPRVVKILQNAKFDYQFLKAGRGISMANIFDTMLAERVLTAGISRRVSLQAMADAYFGLELDKSIRLSFTQGIGHLSDAQLRYAAEDAAILFPLYEKQKQRLEEEGLGHVAQLEFDALVPIAEMELAGLVVDVIKWNEIIKGHKRQRDQAKQEVFALLDEGIAQQTLFPGVDPINLNSQAQVIQTFSNLGIALEDTSEDTLKGVEHPAAQKLLEYREHDKLVGAFGDKFLSLIRPDTGRIHPDFQQYGADTGRFSCQNPNVQQIPASFRSCFVARPGYKIITCDYSQAELRILAHLSRDPGFCEAFRSGGDLHAITASQMFGIPPEQVTKAKRSQAKAINFGLAYGRGPASLAGQLGTSIEEAKALIAQYFRAYAGIGAWLESAARDAVHNGYSITPMGRKRFYTIPAKSDPDYKSKVGAIERRGKNTPIQGANADMVKYAFVFLYESLKEYDARLINTVHDEVVVEVREDQVEQVVRVVEREMIRAAERFVTAVPIKADAVVSDHWSK